MRKHEVNEGIIEERNWEIYPQALLFLQEFYNHVHLTNMLINPCVENYTNDLEEGMQRLSVKQGEKIVGGITLLWFTLIQDGGKVKPCQAFDFQ